MRASVVVLVVAAACGRLGFDPGVGTDGDAGTDGPRPEGRWRSVAIGRTFGCGVAMDGALWCWGNGYPVPGSSGWLIVGPQRIGDAAVWDTVTVEDRHACALRTDGTLWCWGYNIDGSLGAGPASAMFVEPQHVSPGTTWKRVATGIDFTCAIRGDDTLWCWGHGEDGQLGLGSLTNVDRPAQVGTATWVEIDLGDRSACGLQTDRTLWCWGANNEGQVGDNSTATRTAPVQVTGSAWKTVSVGGEHACAIKSDDATWCWGRNYEAQIGDGSRARRTGPIQVYVPTASPQVQLLASSAHTCARSAAGEIACWGEASRGRIAGIDAIDVVTPTVVTSPAATQLIVGHGTTCVLDADARLSCTGWNQTGQTGTGGGAVQILERSDDRTDWGAIAAHAGQTCGLTKAGEIECWGRGRYGQIGDGPQVDRQEPTRTGVTAARVIVSRDTTFSAGSGTLGVWGYDHALSAYQATPRMFVGDDVAASSRHVCVVGGTSLGCLGQNDAGELGDGTTTDRPALTVVPGEWTDVAADEYVTCAIAATSRLLSCWGYGPATGTNTTSDVLVPARVPAITGAVSKVELGANAGCAIEAPGALWCWGANAFGQLGDGTVTDRLTAVRIGARIDWIDVDLGDLHTCGITADGALWCWGHVDEGQHGDGADALRVTPVRIGAATDWTDVACGDHYTCALRTDGTRWCSGAAWWGQLGNGRAWFESFTSIP